MPQELLYRAASLADALSALTDRGASGAPLAGATWIMRASIRGEQEKRSYVAVGEIDELRRTKITDSTIVIGAGITHAELEVVFDHVPGCEGLVQAATRAANPAIRQRATIGGNLCAWRFAASDLAPALLCLDAVVDVETPSGSERMPLDGFLLRRSTLGPAAILKQISFTRSPLKFAHIRLPLRRAGDYPVVIVSMGVKLGTDSVVEDVRVSVGSVEAAARRWTALEVELRWRPADAGRAAEAAEAHAREFQGRDGVEAPGWYRIKVLPTLVRRAMQALIEQSHHSA